MASPFQFQRASHMKFFGGPSVWLEFTILSKLTKSINLGQGAPGWGAPQFLNDELVKATQSNNYAQYAPPQGAPVLVNEIQKQYFPRVTPSELQAQQPHSTLDMVVTNGASQALSLACNALLEKGDEVILMEPAFDFYIGAVHSNGAKPVYVPLKYKHSATHSDAIFESNERESLSSEDFELDYNELKKKLNKKTRMLILNSPHNPTGKIFSKQEFLKIADILDTYAPDCIVLSDEVYEHLIFSNNKHISFASVSKSAHLRTLSIFSSGKTFSATGLKIGWVIGQNNLLNELKILQQFKVFSVCHISQIAIGNALKLALTNNYYNELRQSYFEKRNILIDILKRIGFIPIIPQAAFYICAHIPKHHPLRQVSAGGLPKQIQTYIDQNVLHVDTKTIHRNDYNVCRNLIVNHGVTSIPLSAFFSHENIGISQLSDCVVRFAFCHPNDALEEAGKRLLTFNSPS